MLNKNWNLSNKDLKGKLLEGIKDLDFKELAKDVEPFLFNPSDSKKVEMFKEFIEQAEL